jgi:hypothetical protein
MIPGGVPNFELKNVRVINFDTGIKVDGTARVLAEGLELSGNRVSIDISDDGELHDFNTTIE